jgi:hypothetical protein
MTLEDLQRLVQSSQTQSEGSGQSQKLWIKLERTPFWMWDLTRHKEKGKSSRGACCFNHIIGLPKKDGKPKPMFDYEMLLFKSLTEAAYLNSLTSGNIAYSFKDKHLFVKKATGLGVTEFMLRFIAWLCLRNDDYRQSQMVIVTGPNQELAIKLIKRIKALFEPHNISFDSKETVIELNGCSIEAYPSNHIDAFRSLTNPKFILLDECDFFRKNEQDDVRHVSERYIAKSDPFIVMVSTPNAPGGLFEKIEKESFDTCIYKKLFLDYTYGLGKIYSKEEIDKARASPSFEREYCLKYQGLIGNVFSLSSIELCQKIEYNPNNINPHAKKSIGLDPSFGSSKFGIVAMQLIDGKIQVIHAEEYDRPNFTDMINVIWSLKQQYGHVSNIYVDAANPEVWQALKKEFGEPYNQQYINDQRIECRKYNFNLEDRMIIVPVPFSIEGGHMLQHTKWLLEETKEDGSSLIAIHSTFEKLLTSLRTAVANEYKLDKEQTAYNDILDAFRLSLQFYKRSKT